ncbi:MAG: triose-phosphate isomerase [Elusimicrobiota bacterium]
MNKKRNNKNEMNLFRDIFPYSEVPRVVFDKKCAELDMPQDIWITDTTFRDGQQARAPYTVKQIVDLFTFMHRLGGEKGLIKFSEFFLYSNKDREAVRRCQEKGFEFPRITGWIRAVEKDFDLVKKMGLKETGILTSASDYHIYLKLKTDRSTAMEKYLRVVDSALENGIVPRCHLEDITRADFEGFVLPFVKKLMQRAKESKMPVKIRACDTLGYGIPHPQASLPRSVPKIMEKLRKECEVPSEWLEWHGHNDFHKVVACGFHAWLYGASAVNGTLLGYGERTGNPPLEALVIDYLSLKGKSEDVNTGVITQIGDYFRNEFDEHIPSSFPFVGSDFNTTRAGIHADGLIKNEEIYNIFDTGKLLGRPMNVAISDKSGTAGVALWINNFLNLKGDERIDKNNEKVAKIYKIVMEKYKAGRTTAMSNEEMEHLAKEYFPSHFVSEFEHLKKKAANLAEHLVEELSENEEIRSLDSEKMEKAMEEIRRKHDFIQFIYVVDRKGVKVTRNIINPRYKVEFEHKDVGVIYTDRQWFTRAIESGLPFVSDFYISKMTGRLCITVSSPVRDENDRIVAVVGIDISFEELVKL